MMMIFFFVKWQKLELHFVIWQKNCLCLTSLDNQIILEAKSMDESSWKFHTITNQEDSSMDLAPESFEDLVVQWS